MALESVVNIADFTVTNPTATDPKSQGDDHIRNIKTALKNDFAGFTGAVLVSGVDGGAADVYTLTPANALVAYTSKMIVEFTPVATNLTTTPTLNISGLGAKTIKSVADGALLVGDLVIGCYYLAVYDGTDIRLLSSTKNYADQLSFTTALPAQAGNGGKFLKTSGSAASWEYAGIASVTSITSATTLTASNIAYHTVAMTSLGLSVTLPDATTLTVGTPKAVFKNTGGYPFGIRDSAGTLLMSVAAGGVAYVSLDSISTAAGSWSITGGNLEPALVTIDNTFSSTYLTTQATPFVALDANKSIHFALLSSGFAAFAVDKTTAAVGTPVTVSATASMVPRAVFKINSTTAHLFYSSTTGTLIGVVVSLTGVTATSISVGTPSSTLTATGCGIEDSISAPKIAQLDSTHYIVSYATATGAGSTTVAAWEVTSGTTSTLGSAADIITSNNIINSTTTYALTPTTALVLYKSGAAAPYANIGVVITVSGSSCSVGTPAALTGVGSSLVGAPMSCLLSATKCLVTDDNNTAGSVISSAFTIASTTVTAGTLVSVETGITTSPIYTSNGATKFNPHMWMLSSTTAGLWYLDSSGISRTVVLTEAATVVSKGTITYRNVSRGSTSGNGGGIMLPQGTTEFMSAFHTVNGAIFAGIRFQTNKILAGAITAGNQVYYDWGIPASGTSDISALRLSSGDYVMRGLNATVGLSEIPIFRANGDAINFRGTISVPNITLGAAINDAAVASNRFIVIGSGALGTTTSSSSNQLRLLNIEVAV